MKPNQITPIYSRAVIGYKCSCGNRMDWIIRGIKRSRIIECTNCGASRIIK